MACSASLRTLDAAAAVAERQGARGPGSPARAGRRSGGTGGARTAARGDARRGGHRHPHRGRGHAVLRLLERRRGASLHGGPRHPSCSTTCWSCERPRLRPSPAMPTMEAQLESQLAARVRAERAAASPLSLAELAVDGRDIRDTLGIAGGAGDRARSSTACCTTSSRTRRVNRRMTAAHAGRACSATSWRTADDDEAPAAVIG